MTQNDSERYITAEQAAQIIGRDSRSVHRYGESGTIRTRKAGRRTMFHAGDVQRLADDIGAQRRALAEDDAAQLRNQLQQATYRIGYLEAQLEQRLLPDHAMQMRDELTQLKTERDMLQQQLQSIQAQLERARAPWRMWLFVILLVIVAVLVTYLVIVRM